jgi:hypothetical protein
MNARMIGANPFLPLQAFAKQIATPILKIEGQSMNASVVKCGALSMQVCVPIGWKDEDVIAFVERENPCGTENGWQIRREGDEALAGCAERVRCAKDDRNVHIMLDA